MSVPEISHRCPWCGASTRDIHTGALFCPECGKALAGPNAESAAEAGEIANSVDPEIPVQANSAAAAGPLTADTESAEAKPHLAPDDRHRARERTRETLQRASTRARGAIEGNVKRVEKIHHVSTVMFEEATYDPSLRFVLVALGLFVIFVILLVLSKVMG